MLRNHFAWALVLLSSEALAIGKVTFTQGDVTTLAMTAAPQKPLPVHKSHVIQPEHSYLTHELSQAVIQFDDGTWVRVGADTKFEVTELSTGIEIRLHTGSLRVLFSPRLKQQSTDRRLKIRTLDGLIETSEAKFTVTFKPLFQQTSVYVEKGLVQFSGTTTLEEQLPETIHAGEFSEIVRSETLPRKGQRMTEREKEMIKDLLFSQLKNAKDKL